MCMSYTDQLRANVVSQLSKREMSQAVAGEFLNLRQNSISARLYGKTEFRLKELLILAELFEVSIHELLAGVEYEYLKNRQTEGVAS